MMEPEAWGSCWSWWGPRSSGSQVCAGCILRPPLSPGPTIVLLSCTCWGQGRSLGHSRQFFTFCKTEAGVRPPAAVLDPLHCWGRLAKLTQPHSRLSGLTLRNCSFCAYTNVPSISWFFIFWNTGFRTLREHVPTMEAFLMMSCRIFPHLRLTNWRIKSPMFTASHYVLIIWRFCGGESKVFIDFCLGKSHLIGWFPASELVVFHRNSPEICHKLYSVALAESVDRHKSVFYHLDKDCLGF